jgi:hypothetical protein
LPLELPPVVPPPFADPPLAGAVPPLEGDKAPPVLGAEPAEPLEPPVELGRLPPLSIGGCSTELSQPSASARMVHQPLPVRMDLNVLNPADRDQQIEGTRAAP